MKPKKPRKLTLPLAKIRLDGATQPRAKLDDDVRREYRDLLKAGKELPPVVVFKDRAGELWLADGFHRRWGAVDANLDKIKCLVYEGELKDARWYSYSANQGHGLRRSNDDKRKAVKAALLHPKGAKMSNGQIAEHVGVDEKTVRKYRGAAEASSDIPKIDTRTVQRGDQEYEVNVANIGRTAASEPDTETEDADAPDPCPTCGSTERTDDGDCSQCYDPCDDEPEDESEAISETLDPFLADIESKVKAWLKKHPDKSALAACFLENLAEQVR